MKNYSFGLEDINTTQNSQIRQDCNQVYRTHTNSGSRDFCTRMDPTEKRTEYVIFDGECKPLVVWTQLKNGRNMSYLTESDLYTRVRGRSYLSCPYNIIIIPCPLT